MRTPRGGGGGGGGLLCTCSDTYRKPSGTRLVDCTDYSTVYMHMYTVKISACMPAIIVC